MKKRISDLETELRGIQGVNKLLESENEDLEHRCNESDVAYEELELKNDKLQAFYDYMRDLYGEGLEVANWHLNGDLEPFDNFFESAEKQ